MQADWGKMEKEREKSGKQGRARSWGGFGVVVENFFGFCRLTALNNNPNHKALTQVIGVLEKWDSKTLNALLMVLSG